MSFPKDLVLWNGLVPLQNVKLQLIENSMTKFPSDLETKREKLWEEWKGKYPSSYDGTLVKYLNHQQKDGNIVITTELIKYSQMLVVSKYQLVGSNWDGQLGIAMAIYDDEKSHILIGKRAKNNPYRPGYWSLVGGIIEEKDLDGNIRDCCLRELEEEIDLDFTDVQMNLRGIIHNLEYIGRQLIIDVHTSFDPTTEITTNEEWEDGSLKWYPIDEIPQFTNENMLNDLKFKISISQ